VFQRFAEGDKIRGERQGKKWHENQGNRKYGKG
jgi:hypothetical protein